MGLHRSPPHDSIAKATTRDIFPFVSGISIYIYIFYYICCCCVLPFLFIRYYYGSKVTFLHLQPSDSHQSISIQPVAVGRIHTHSLTTNEKEGRLSIMTSETNDDDVPVLNNNNDDADDDDEAKEEVTDLSSRYVHDTPFDLLYLYVMGDTPWFPTHTFTSHTPHYLNTHTHFTSLPQHSLPTSIIHHTATFVRNTKRRPKL